jgi:hypothetical protein
MLCASVVIWGCEAMSLLRQSVAGRSPQRPRLILGQSTPDLWWIKWYLDWSSLSTPVFYPVSIILPTLHTQFFILATGSIIQQHTLLTLWSFHCCRTKNNYFINASNKSIGFFALRTEQYTVCMWDTSLPAKWPWLTRNSKCTYYDTFAFCINFQLYAF